MTNSLEICASKPARTSTTSILERIQLEKPVVFGQIDFVNCLPITLPLVANLPAAMTLTMGNPGQLNKRYAEGELDIGAMSAHFLLTSPDFQLIPTLSISSQNEVGSVFLFSKRPLSELSGCRIGVPYASATSVCLLKVLIKEEFGLSPEFVFDNDPEPFDERFQAVLMIGDAALNTDERLKERAALQSQALVRVDLGEWLRRLYQLPMVFGVWGARSSYVQANPADFVAICSFLGETWRHGLSEEYPAVLSEAERRTGLSRRILDAYFRSQLDFDFSAEHEKALALFKQLALKHGLL